MGWNKRRYEESKRVCANDISKGYKTAKEYMEKYKEMIIKEDYESAKAITEVLEPLNYYTSDTHRHINQLNTKKK